MPLFSDEERCFAKFSGLNFPPELSKLRYYVLKTINYYKIRYNFLIGFFRNAHVLQVVKICQLPWPEQQATIGYPCNVLGIADYFSHDVQRPVHGAQIYTN